MISNNQLSPLAKGALPDVGYNDDKLLIYGREGEFAHISNLGPISDVAVERATNFVDGSGIVERMEYLHETWKRALRGSRAGAGRPATMTFRQVMVLYFICMLDEKAPLATRIEEVVERMSDEQLTTLNLDPDKTRTPGLYRRVLRTVHRFLDSVDPYPIADRRKRMEWDEHQRILAEEAADPNIDVMRHRMDWWVEALLEGTWRSLPMRNRQAWGGNLSVDGTKVEGPQDGTYPKQERVSSDRDSAWWGRHGDHSVEQGKGKKTKHVNGYEATLAVTAPNYPHTVGAPMGFPMLALGMGFHRPGTGITVVAGQVTASVHRRGHPAGLWLGDGALFPQSRAEYIQMPVRAMGYQFAADPTGDDAGVQESHKGAKLVEGAWYSPSMPEVLIEATREYEAAKAKAKTPADREAADALYRRRIELRKPYELKLRELTIGPGGKIPYACPHGITVSCPLKMQILQDRENERAARSGEAPKKLPAPKGANGKTLLPLPLKNMPTKPDAICTNVKSTHFDAEAGIRFIQAFPGGSEEQSAAYDLRTTIEGFNGYIKDGNYQAVDDAERRLLQGYAGQYFLTAILVTAQNLRKVRSFLETEAARPVPTKAGANKLPKPYALGALSHLLPEEPLMDLHLDHMDRRRIVANKRQGDRRKSTTIEPMELPAAA